MIKLITVSNNYVLFAFIYIDSTNSNMCLMFSCHLSVVAMMITPAHSDKFDANLLFFPEQLNYNKSKRWQVLKFSPLINNSNNTQVKLS